MSDIDLTEAVRVFKAAWHAADAHGHEGHRTEIALAAAAPLIARQAERPQEQPPEVQSHRCIAHGTPLCPACARILPEHITQDGECDSCSTWGERGYHWDTCQRRIRGGDVTTWAAVQARRHDGRADAVDPADVAALVKALSDKPPGVIETWPVVAHRLIASGLVTVKRGEGR